MYTDQQLFALRDYLHKHGCTPANFRVVTPLPQQMQIQKSFSSGIFAHTITENRTRFTHEFFFKIWVEGKLFNEIFTHEDEREIGILLGENACEIALDTTLDLVHDQRFGGYDFLYRRWEALRNFAHKTTFSETIFHGENKRKFFAQNKRFKIELIWDSPTHMQTNPEVLLSISDKKTRWGHCAFYHPEYQFDTAFLAWLLPPDLLKSTLLPFDNDSLPR